MVTEQELLAEMALVLDELSEIPRDAIAERSKLHARQSHLRSELAELQSDHRLDTEQEWAEQAGRKARSDDSDVSGTIPSPSEWGSSGVA